MFRYRVYTLAACVCLASVAAQTWAQPDPSNPLSMLHPGAKDPQWIDTFMPELMFRVRKEGESSEKQSFINGMFLNQEGLVLTVLPELRNDQTVEVVDELLVDKANPPKIAVLARDPKTGLTLLKTPFRCQRFYRLAQQPKPLPKGIDLAPLIPLLPPFSDNSFRMMVEEVRGPDPQSPSNVNSVQLLLLRKQIKLAFLQSGLGPSTIVTKFLQSSETFSLLPSNPPGEPLPGTALAIDFQVAAVTLGPIPVEDGNAGTSTELYQAISAEAARPIIEQLLKKLDLPALPAFNLPAQPNTAADSEEIPAEAVRIPVRYDNGDVTAVNGVLFDQWGTIVSPVETFIGAQKLTSRWLELNLDLEWLSEESFAFGLTVLRLPSTSTSPHVVFEINAIPILKGDRVYRSPPQSKAPGSAQPDSKPILVVSVDQTVPISTIPGAMRSGLWLINHKFPAGTPLFHETGAFIGMVAPDFTEQGSYVIPADQAWIAYGKSPQAARIADIENERQRFQSGKQVVRTHRCDSLPTAKSIRTRLAGLFPAYQFSVDPKSSTLVFVADRKAEIDDLTAIYFLANLMADRIEKESAKRIVMGTDNSPATNDAAQENSSGPRSEPESISIPVGMRVVTVPAMMPLAQIDTLKREDRVDVMVTYKVQPSASRAHSETRTFLTNIQVFATDSSPAPKSDLEDGGKGVVVKNISLLVTQDQAQTIEMAKRTGELALHLRKEGDKAETEGNNLTPEQFRTQILQAATKPGAALAPSESSNPSIDSRKARAQALDRLSQEVVQKYRSASPDDQPAHRKILERVTSELFDVRHQQRLDELKTLEARLEKLRASLNTREQLKVTIVQQRVTDLLKIENPLKWEEDSEPATSETSAASGTTSGNSTPESQLSSDLGSSTGEPGSTEKRGQTSQSPMASPGGSKPLRKTEEMPVTKLNDPAQPLLTGAILQVNFDGDAEISIGSAEGLKLGQVLDVSRQPPNTPTYAAEYTDARPQESLPTVFGFIGQLEVVAIQSDRATCIPVPGSRRDFMRNSDQVTSDLRLSKKLDLSDEDLKALQGSWMIEVAQSSVANGPDLPSPMGTGAPAPQPTLDSNIIWKIDGNLLQIRHQNGKFQARGVVSLGRTKKTKFLQVRQLVQIDDPVPNRVPPSDSQPPSTPRPPVAITPPSTFFLLYRIRGDILEMQEIDNYKSLANLPAEFGTPETPEGRLQIMKLKRVPDGVTASDKAPKAGNSRPRMPAEESQ